MCMYTVRYSKALDDRGQPMICTVETREGLMFSTSRLADAMAMKAELSIVFGRPLRDFIVCREINQDTFEVVIEEQEILP